MWTNNVNVTREYASSHSKNAFAVLSGISGWRKIKALSNDGVTNCFSMLNAAMVNNRRIDVFIVDNEIERVVMH